MSLSFEYGSNSYEFCFLSSKVRVPLHNQGTGGAALRLPKTYFIDKTPIDRAFSLHGHGVVTCVLAGLQLCAAAAVFVCPLHAVAQARPSPVDAAQSPAVVIAFVGGFVHSDDARHSEIQIARALQSSYGKDVQVEIFRNRDRKRAHKFIVDWWQRREHAKEGNEKVESSPLILYGHSWGASAAVLLARELQRDGIPVALTIQVDSVRKNGQNDSIIPSNVAEAINFYQPDGIVHGRTRIVAADPARTKILGNLRFKYEQEPAECRAYPWYDKFFFKGHTAIECDPRVWTQVDTLIRTRLPSPPKPAESSVVSTAR